MIKHCRRSNLTKLLLLWLWILRAAFEFPAATVSPLRNWVWWLRPVISALERLSQEDYHDSEAMLSYIVSSRTLWEAEAGRRITMNLKLDWVPGHSVLQCADLILKRKKQKQTKGLLWELTSVNCVVYKQRRQDIEGTPWIRSLFLFFLEGSILLRLYCISPGNEQFT